MTEETKPRKKRVVQKKYLRNLRFTIVSCRASKDRRIELRPRGQRGDLAPISKDELADTRIQSNLGVLFEIVNEDKALEIMRDQTTNQQTVHPALDSLRNEKGEKFSNPDVVVAKESFQKQGVKVAEFITDDHGNQIGIKRVLAAGSAEFPASTPPSSPEGRAELNAALEGFSVKTTEPVTET